MIGLLMLAVVTTGPYLTGNELVEACAPSQPLELECLGYITGVVDGTVVAQAAAGNRFICVPDGVTRGQLKAVALKYLGDHPERRQEAAGALTIFAMQAAFPCPK